MASKSLPLIESLLKLLSEKEEKPKNYGNLDPKKVKEYIENSWKESVLDTLCEYIKIPNQSPDFDSDIHKNGYQEKALNLLKNWVLSRKLKNLNMEILHEKGKTPLIFMDIKSSDEKCKDTILMYGHFDKQPPMTKDWDEDLHPHKPVIKNGKLYGRGGADDGYSIFGCIDAIGACQDQNVSYPRCQIIIEGSEESGSPDLWFYLSDLLSKKKLVQPNIVICLDSGCGNYEQLWCTVSLRGIIIGYLKAQLLKEGIHSGGSGLVRDSFHVLRTLLDRIDNSNTGEMLKELNVEIPETHIDYAKQTSKVLGKEIYKKLPFAKENIKPQIKINNNDNNDNKDDNKDDDNINLNDLLLQGIWKPQLSITGIDGIPDLKGGNVLRKYTTLKLSIRLPPSLDCNYAAKILKSQLEKNPPYNSIVEFDASKHFASGFVCPDFEPWLLDILHESSELYYGKDKKCCFLGEGGSIPLMGQLLDKFPKSQFVIVGVLGPNSNAHGPNEFIHINFTKNLICCLANIIHMTAQHSSQ